jgi:hypothetical protein
LQCVGGNAFNFRGGTHGKKLRPQVSDTCGDEKIDRHQKNSLCLWEINYVFVLAFLVNAFYHRSFIGLLQE